MIELLLQWNCNNKVELNLHAFEGHDQMEMLSVFYIVSYNAQQSIKHSPATSGFMYLFFICRAYFLVPPQFCQSDLYAYSRPGRIMLHL